MEKPELTSAQRDNLEKLKVRLKDFLEPHQDDFYLVKWLRVRNWDVSAAEKSLREDKEWRRINEIDKILSTYDPPEVLKKYYPGGFCGVSKEGMSVHINPIANADLRGLYQSVSKKEMFTHVIWQFEHFYKVVNPELSKKYGKKIDQCLYIADMEGYGMQHMWKPAVDTTGELVKLMEDHYPDTYRCIIGINAPALLPIAYNLFRPFLSQNLRSKIKIYGTNYKEHLLKEIDADQLPVHWGGTATDPDGDSYCRSKVCMGGKVPEKYYKKNLLQENTDLSKFTSVTIQHGSTLQLDYPVNVKDSLLSWNFYTEDKDIGFSVCRRKAAAAADQVQKANEMDVIVPKERVNSHLIPESGSFMCEIPGTYVVIFYNDYSWLNAKKLSYFVEVIEPKVEENWTEWTHL